MYCNIQKNEIIDSEVEFTSSLHNQEGSGCCLVRSYKDRNINMWRIITFSIKWWKKNKPS
jgi:hypothetical protein